MPEIEGFGTVVQSGDGTSRASSTVWTTIGKLADVEPPENDVADIKTTHMQSPNHAHEYQAGLIETGLCKATIHFAPSNQANLNTLLRAPKGYRVMFSDGSVPTNGSTVGFDGYLKKIGSKTPMEDIVTQDLEIKVSGLPVFTAGT